jgi:hypothetical protein
MNILNNTEWYIAIPIGILFLGIGFFFIYTSLYFEDTKDFSTGGFTDGLMGGIGFVVAGIIKLIYFICTK